ncbi:MAG TPA: proprotein convertase P-domain-containing protein [Thermoanaerobaculia bacterium]|jgi:subtilisin-like proprotein convertase family protein|nr:proprotein convertase P-domain-containing protein [Thermoanaerobaculia bacterium]
MSRFGTLLAGLCLVVVATTGTARAEEELLPKAERMRLLLPAYEAVRNDPAIKALDQRASANPRNRAAVDAFLKAMPLSPLEYMEIDMERRHYEIVVPRFVQEFHVRWMELHESLARSIYGDEHVDQVLSRWPADYGYDANDISKITGLATVGTNRNVASTDVPPPNEFDGEIQIAVNHRNTNQMVAAANTWGTAGAACNNEETQSIFYSSNGGATWDYTCAPSNNVFTLGTCSATVFGSDPALYWNDNNEVFLNYMLLCSSSTTTQYSMVVARSADGGATWVKQGVIKNAWATGTLEDKNFYAIDNTSTSPFYGRHYTCWDRANNEKFAYSSNNGVTWTEVDLPAAGVGGVDLGCEIAVQKNGTVHVVFESLTCGSNCTDERMWYTKSTNGGVSWSTPVQVHDHNLTGFSGANTPPVADQRGIAPFGAIDVDNSGGACDGTLYATYGDYTSGGATETDIWVTRSTNGGTTWGTPVKVNDDGLAGRTQFHPFLQVDQSTGNVVVAWHDARNDANNRKVEIFTARSTNCGVSFEANVKASQASTEFNNSAISYTDENTTDNANRNPNQYGEYMGLDVKNGKAYVAWVDTRHFYPGSTTNAQKENVGFTVVDFGGACVPPSPPTGVTATSASASSINVSWTASAGATSYNILRSTTSGGPYTQVGTSATTSFPDTGLSCNTTYYYVVQAVGACASGNSAQASATTSACSTNSVLTFSASPALAIPDNNTTGVTSTINVPDSMTITSVSVNVGITHTYQGDLEVALIGPDNTTVLLHNRTGAGTDNINTTYNITTRSAQALSAFNGKNTSGAWKLRVRDLAAADTGTFNSWKVTFNGYQTLTANTAIPDNNTTGITSTINVPATGTIVSLRVRVDITHTYQGDLEVSLIGPDNTTVILHNRTGGTTDNIQTVYADLTAPNQALSAFTGKAINGAWKLKVRDLAAADTGTLNFWEIDFRTN